jgi:hypothetical protein
MDENTGNIIKIEAGFYDEQGNYAPNYVYSHDYELLKENKDNYTYPYHGWTWKEKFGDE